MTNEPNPVEPNPPSDAISSAPIPVAPPLKPAAPSKPADKTKPPQQDGFRELIETVVFVVVLVLILKTFLAEAFVIPTGWMATTLLGYHKEVTCEQCGYRFLVNCSSEADPGERHPQPVTGCYCENCQYFNNLVGRGAFR